MRMGLDQTWHYRHPGQVDYLRLGGNRDVARRANGLDALTANHNKPAFVERSRFSVEDARRLKYVSVRGLLGRSRPRLSLVFRWRTGGEAKDEYEKYGAAHHSHHYELGYLSSISGCLLLMGVS